MIKLSVARSPYINRSESPDIWLADRDIVHTPFHAAPPTLPYQRAITQSGWRQEFVLLPIFPLLRQEHGGRRKHSLALCSSG